MNASNDDRLAQFFQEVLLVLGGVFALQPTNDATVWQVTRGLEHAYRRARRQTATPNRRTAAHPAISRLLGITHGGRRSRP